MKAVIDTVFKRSRTTIMILVLILIAGTISYIDIPKEAAPDINIPIIYVTVSHRGISPEDAERLLVQPLEQELRSVEGVKEMRSTAFEGGANVLLEFDAGFDADQALLDVREQVDIAKPELPKDSDEPTVNEINFSQFPMFIIALSGAVPERALLRTAHKLKDEIEGIPAVLEVDIGGDRDEQVEIIIDPSLVQSYGLSSFELVNFFTNSNKLVAAGIIDNGKGRFSIKVPGLIETVQEVMDFPVKIDGDAVVRLKDIATGRRAFEDAKEYTRSNGKSAVTLEISKRTGTNIIETARKIREVVERESKDWSKSIEYKYTLDKSDEIDEMLNDLQNSVIMAILLVMVVIVAALGIRTGALVGIAIPGSFLMSILALSIMGFTINMVVLFGLIVSVGMLVDGAIVITEYADRKLVEGKPKYVAYGLAAKRMAMPVIASTATTLAAFIPLAFWTGVVGEFMKYLPITIITTLISSLFMGLIFVPTLGSIFGKAGIADKKTMKAIAASEHGDLSELTGFTGKYVKLLQTALSMPVKIILASIFMLFAAQIVYWTFGNGIEFFPNIEPKNIRINVHAQGNLSIDEKDNLIKEVEKLIIGIPDIDSVYARTGHKPKSGSEDVIGVIKIRYKDWNERRKSSEIINEIREKAKVLAGVYIDFHEEQKGPRQGKSIEIEVSSRNPELLEKSIEHIKKGFNEIKGLVDIEDSRSLPGIQWEVKIDRAQAAKSGVFVSAVGDMIQLITKGLKFSDYRPENSDDEIDIVARYPEKYRTIDEINRVHVSTAAGSARFTIC